MDHLKGQLTVFNHWSFYFKVLVQYKVMVICKRRWRKFSWNIQNVCGHKSETMELNICMGDNTHTYYKYKFH